MIRAENPEKIQCNSKSGGEGKRARSLCRNLQGTVFDKELWRFKDNIEVNRRSWSFLVSLSKDKSIFFSNTDSEVHFGWGDAFLFCAKPTLVHKQRIQFFASVDAKSPLYPVQRAPGIIFTNKPVVPKIKNLRKAFVATKATELRTDQEYFHLNAKHQWKLKETFTVRVNLPCAHRLNFVSKKRDWTWTEVWKKRLGKIMVLLLDKFLLETVSRDP